MLALATITSWISLMRERVARCPDRMAYGFLERGNQIEQLTYAQLDQKARSIASALQTVAKPGERALLLYPSCLEYVAGFLGCLYAGVIAVPVYPPQHSRLRRGDSRVQKIIADSQPVVALTRSSLLAPGSPIPEICRKDLKLLATDEVSLKLAEDWNPPLIASGDIAFLQYTSGSTAAPRGVAISHGNLLANEERICNAFEHDERTVVVGWLPLYHDMGLIGNVLQPLYCGGTCILMSSVSVLQDPSQWLSAISRYRATTSGGPNFAFDLCARKISAEQKASLDLSSWRVAFNGAEPVRPETLDRFSVAFEECGFRRTAFYPCYGLAESTLIVSGGAVSKEPLVRLFESGALSENKVIAAPGQKEARPLVGCGLGLPGQEIAIVHPTTRTECRADEIGEIWLSGPSVARGYWNKPELTEEIFGGELPTGRGKSYLRTGDLGFFFEGELFITGRLKDLIIIRGRNHYPQDIEATVQQSHPGLRQGCGAAFSVEVEGEERLVVVQELERSLKGDLAAVVSAIRQNIAREHAVQAHAIVLLKTSTIPKTSSGKLQRHLCKQKFLANALDTVHADALQQTGGQEGLPELSWTDLVDAEPTEQAALLKRFLRHHAAQVLRVSPSEIEVEKTLGHYGFDSLMAVELSTRIESGVGIHIPMATFLEMPSLDEIAVLVQQRLAERQSPALSPKPAEVVSHLGENPLSFAQEALWLADQHQHNDRAAANILVVVRFDGPLKQRALERSLNEIVRRHEPLRTGICVTNDGPVQKIADFQYFPLLVCDLEAVPFGLREGELRRRAATEVQKPFDLEAGLVWRHLLFRLSTDRHVLALVFHHVACDGWSIGIFLQELIALYKEVPGDALASLPDLTLRYRDFAREQRSLSAVEWDKQLVYWKRQLRDPRPPAWPAIAPLSFAKSPAMLQGFELSDSLSQKLKSFAGQEKCTLFMVLCAAFKALLYRHCGTRELIIGTSTANRARFGRQSQIGPFTNALAFRSELPGDPSFLGFLAQIRRTALDAFANEEVPYEMVLRELGSNRPDRAPLFQTVFVFQNFLSTSWKIDDLHVELEEFDSGMSQFGLALAMYEKGGQLVGSFKYKTDVFSAGTIEALRNSFQQVLERIITDPGCAISMLPVDASLLNKSVMQSTGQTPATVAVAATFTAELLEENLNFWSRELGFASQTVFAPFNQIFQELLRPQSLQTDNAAGVNILLVRLSDWITSTEKSHPPQDSLDQNVTDFLAALSSFVERSRASCFVCLCPSIGVGNTSEIYRQSEGRMCAEISRLKNVHLITTAELLDLYPISEVHDPHADKVGAVPYSNDFFVALGALLARRIYSLRAAPVKVVVLDCDDTLWQGTCGEAGALGVEVDSPHAALQQFMIEQRAAGKLLCLASKNAEEDVWEVFENNPSMVLRREHLSAWRINWDSKSKNLRALAKELGLGLDSFIFIDDNPIECAEVQANCPEVLVLPLPADSRQIPDFLKHLWAFDRHRSTNEDQHRAAFYQQNVQREHLRDRSATLEDFLASLELKVDIRSAGQNDIERIAQLSQRTNQFNTTTVRRNAVEVERLRAQLNCHWYVVEARDRFGDYGMVGAVLTEESAKALRVDSWMLSCRALGKGIEHRIAAFLGEIATEQGCPVVEIEFRPTAKNLPAQSFLEEIAGGAKTTGADGHRYRICATDASRIAYSPLPPSGMELEATPPPATTPRFLSVPGSSDLLGRIARELGSVQQIKCAIVARNEMAPRGRTAFVAPRTPTEEMLADIWTEVLRIGRVSIEDNFFDLGGHSLLATVVLSRIRKAFEVEVPLHVILEQPTITKLARHIEEKLIGDLDSVELSAALAELTGKDDAEIAALIAEGAEFRVPTGSRVGGGDSK